MRSSKPTLWIGLVGALLLAGAALQGAGAATTPLSNNPVTGTGNATPKPNVMLLMDTSRSMAFTHMPDEMEGNSLALPIGYRSAQCNSLYYNPSRTYALPRAGDGTLLGQPTFSAAPVDGYATGSTTVNLASGFQAFTRDTRTLSFNGADDTAQQAYYYVFTPNGASTPTLTYDAAPCTDMAENLVWATVNGKQTAPSPTGNGTWVREHPTTTEQQLHFARWFTYYRTRMAMVKSTMGLAFNDSITSGFRIGLISMNPLNSKGVATSGVNSAKYLAIDDFNTTQRGLWYSKLFSQTPDGSSPAREGLARVGRHYGGKADGINTGMPAEANPPICRQNFTIMTTDGYWNTIDESVGPVRLDGITKVGQQDGDLTPRAVLNRNNPLNYSHRPMWDGNTSGTRVDTDREEMNRYADCDTGDYFRSTSIWRQSTTQDTRRTQSLTRTTEQIRLSTAQTSRSTTQETKTTATETRSTFQRLISTQQHQRTREWERQRRYWTTSGSGRVLVTETQVMERVRYVEETRTQRQSRTVAPNQEKLSRQKQTQITYTQTWTQARQRTTQNLRIDRQLNITTAQRRESTSQTLLSSSQTFASTNQMLAYNGSTETTTPVASCTNTTVITCIPLNTGPTAVASCTAQSPNAGNDYLTRTCNPVVETSVPVQSCTAQSANSGNGFKTVTCSTPTTTNVPVASCTAQTAGAGNGWLTRTCSDNNSGPTPTSSCTAATAGSGNQFTTTTCTYINSTPYAVAACVPVGTGASQVVCPAATTTGPTDVKTCTASLPTSGNSWTTTTCDTPTTGYDYGTCSAPQSHATRVYTCTVSAPTEVYVGVCTAGSTNGTVGNRTVTTCGNVEIVNDWRTVQSCTAASPTTAGSQRRECRTNQQLTAYANVSSCTATSASSSNSWEATQCRDNPVSGWTAKQVNVCSVTNSPNTNGTGLTVSCSAVDQSNPVASCTATSATSVPYRTCSTNTIRNREPTASCTASAPTAPDWITRTCEADTVSPVGNVGSCTPQEPSASNGYVRITCGTGEAFDNIQIGSCTPRTPASSNGWVGIECLGKQTLTEPVPLGSCVAQTGNSGNAFVEITCSTPAATPFTPVASCSAGTNSTTFVVTTCQDNNSGAIRVTPGSCTASNANAGNQFTRTVCTPSSNTVGVAPGTCLAQTPDLNNQFTRITCGTVNTGPTFVAAGTCTDAAATSNNQHIQTTCNTVNTGPTLVAACSPGTDGEFKVTTCDVTRVGPTALAPSAACVSADPTEANAFTRTTCTPVDVTVGVPANSCVPSAPGALTVVSCATVTTPLTAVASCTGGTDGNHLTTTCTRETTDPVRTSSCTAVAPTSASGFQEVICAPVPGLKIQTQTRTRQTTYTVSGSTPLLPTGVHSNWVETGWTDAPGGMCYAAPATPPEVDISAVWKQSTTGMPSGCTAWPCVGEVNTGTAVRGSENSLADVAQYYYVTDLRPDMDNAVPRLGEGIEDDRAPWQHMTTFVVGLGVSGTLGYDTNYKGSTAGDFAKIRNYDLTPGLNWPIWPPGEGLTPAAYEDPRSIDDFWHTAVNGRGKYFSARDPQSVIDGLKEAMLAIKAQAGAGSGAAVSTRSPVTGDNMAYTAGYTSLEWSGDVQAREISLSTGQLSATVGWSARALLDARVSNTCDTRAIYARDPATGGRVNFSWDTFSCDTNGASTGSSSTGLTTNMQALFTDGSKLSQWTHYVSMTDGTNGTVNQRSGPGGAKLVNFLRGQRAYEGFVPDSASKLYRSRTHVLGDIVNSAPLYVKAPGASYQDSGYGTFKAAQASRQAMIYVGANDGMLHAFNAATGKEEWGFVPESVMANMWRLADANYGENHYFFVDGTPSVGDVNVGGNWKTLLVGGLNNGGNGYYALDVTNPTDPQPMWEFKVGNCAANPVGATQDCNLGKTYGRPLIAKLKNGTWVVMVTSGYNNVEQPGSDGGGYLYVLNAADGSIISRIATGAGTSASPSGLREINYFVNSQAFDNTALRAYGGDAQGNVWRFDVNDIISPSGKEAILLGTAVANGIAQPITTRPELADVSGETMVMVGTGKILAEDDLIDTSMQSVYGFKDPMTATAPAYSDLRSELKPMRMSQTGAGMSAGRTIACDSSDESVCASSSGWYIDLPDSGERVNVSMQVVQGMLVFASNVPSNVMCEGGGYSWLNYVNLITGEAVEGGSGGAGSEGGQVSQKFFQNELTVGFTVVNTGNGDGNGNGNNSAIGSGGGGGNNTLPLPNPSPVPQGKRISWREITR